jgi:flagellar biogenesis protein FliO
MKNNILKIVLVIALIILIIFVVRMIRSSNQGTPNQSAKGNPGVAS